MGLVSQAVHDGGWHVIGVIRKTLMPREESKSYRRGELDWFNSMGSPQFSATFPPCTTGMYEHQKEYKHLTCDGCEILLMFLHVQSNFSYLDCLEVPRLMPGDSSLGTTVVQNETMKTEKNEDQLKERTSRETDKNEDSLKERPSKRNTKKEKENVEKISVKPQEEKRLLVLPLEASFIGIFLCCWVPFTW